MISVGRPADEVSFAAGRSAMKAWWAGARPGRDELPWRRERDPWRTLVAETMLAQTQASRVAERYDAVVGVLATPASTAALSVAELLALWAGLGYYRRAVALRRAAERVVEVHAGAVPSELGTLLDLPGVGSYTARAVLAFSFGAKVGVLDTNTSRVLRRAVLGASASPLELQAVADGLVADEDGRDWNLTVMDFGALVCTARAPACSTCPLGAAAACVWRGQPSEPDPARVVRRNAPGAVFVGSDRQYRGRMLKALAAGPMAPAPLSSAVGLEDEPGRARRLLEALVADGMVERGPEGTFALLGWVAARG